MGVHLPFRFVWGRGDAVAVDGSGCGGPLAIDQMAAAVRTAVWSLDPGLPVPARVEMSRALDDALGLPRLRAWLIAVFAGTALLLAAIGPYGTIAFSMQQRRGEIAVRLVLGATSGDVSAMVMRDGLVLTALGSAIGLAVAFAVTRVLATLLFGVGAFDPATVAAVSLLLLVVSAAACYVPARRVSSIDPIAAIRE